METILAGIFIPFLGTAFGAACVFLMKHTLDTRIRQIQAGLAAGIMLAASIWSLLVPAAEQADGQFLPLFGGLAVGFLLMLILDWLLPQEAAERAGSGRMLLALTIHNIPEGIAVGVICAGLQAATAGISASAALAFIVGIAIQNFPEGAILSMPLHSRGMGRGKAFLYGTLSGIVEPIAAALTLLAAERVLPLLPGLLNFAAGAMLYVIFQELGEEMHNGKGLKGIVCFVLGFLLMTFLDCTLG